MIKYFILFYIYTMFIEKFINKIINNIKLNYIDESDCTNNSEIIIDSKCNIVQNYQIIQNSTPESLQNLSYGIYPENINYNNFRFNYNKLHNYYPYAIYYPKNTKQLIYLIINIYKFKLDFSLRCGSHAYEPASLSHGFVIDISKFTKIKIDKKNMIVKVGSGVKLGDLIKKLSKHRLIMTTGDSTCVGISGLSLAGGKSYLSKLYGMVCDNIIGCKMINWKGNEIIINKNTNSDLLWALKGSGHGSYGAITELKFTIYKDIYCKIITITWKWDPIIIYKIINLYQIWIITQPNNITTDLNMTYSIDGTSFYIKFLKFYNSKKNVDDFDEILDFKNCSSNPTISYTENYYTNLLDILIGKNSGYSFPFSKIKSIMVFDIIKEEGINLMIDTINSLILLKKNFQFQINFTELGGIVKDNISSCYFPKLARYVITILNLWDNQELNILGKSIPNNLYTSLINYTSIYCLPNMIDYDLDNFLTSYYGDNQNKLLEIKKKYDPYNFFKWKQSIPI
jgi:hypothetical protein